MNKLKSNFYVNVIFKFLLVISLVCSIFSFIFLENISNQIVTAYAILVSMITFIVLINNKDIPKFGMSMCILLYTIFTQFGAAVIYHFLYNYYDTLLLNYSSFLESTYYSKSILLGCIAITTYVFSITFRFKPKNDNKVEKKDIDEKINSIKKSRILKIGYFFLVTIDIFFVLMVLMGKISFSMSYNEYMNNFSLRLGVIYTIILLIYAIGICFVCSVGNKKEIVIGFILFSITALIFFATGNRGEVLYPLLACIGVCGYRKFKLNWKIVLLIAIIMFFVIPFIRLYRDNKQAMDTYNENTTLIKNMVDPFVEMGMQLRLSVYILEEIDEGSRDYIYGFSYLYSFIKPLEYIIPIDEVINIPEDYNFEKSYPAMGFSQVAESYANLGIFGVVLFYYIFGIIMRNIETKELDCYGICFCSCFTEIMINATRNYFSMVPVMILIVLIILLGIKHIKKHEKYGGINGYR